MPFKAYGIPPDPSTCTDLGTLPIGNNVPHDAPEGLAGKPIPDSARIREAVYLMQVKPGPHMAKIKLRQGHARIYVGPDGWRLDTSVPAREEISHTRESENER